MKQGKVIFRKGGQEVIKDMSKVISDWCFAHVGKTMSLTEVAHDLYQDLLTHVLIPRNMGSPSAQALLDSQTPHVVSILFTTMDPAESNKWRVLIDYAGRWELHKNDALVAEGKFV